MVLSERWLVSDDDIVAQVEALRDESTKQPRAADSSGSRASPMEVPLRRLLAGAPLVANPQPIVLNSAMATEVAKRSRSTPSRTGTGQLPSRMGPTPSTGSNSPAAKPQQPQQHQPPQLPQQHRQQQLAAPRIPQLGMPLPREPAEPSKASERRNRRGHRFAMTQEVTSARSSKQGTIRLSVWLPFAQAQLLVAADPDMPVHTWSDVGSPVAVADAAVALADAAASGSSSPWQPKRPSLKSPSASPRARLHSLIAPGGQQQQHQRLPSSRASRYAKPDFSTPDSSLSPQHLQHEAAEEHASTGLMVKDRGQNRHITWSGPGPVGDGGESPQRSWASLQALIEDFTGLPVQEQQLRFGSTRIDKACGKIAVGTTLAECSVVDGSTIVVTVSALIESAPCVKGVQQCLRTHAAGNRAGGPVWVVLRWEPQGKSTDLSPQSFIHEGPIPLDFTATMHDAPHTWSGQGSEGIRRGFA